jgi:hypothetical protein
MAQTLSGVTPLMRRAMKSFMVGFRPVELERFTCASLQMQFEQVAPTVRGQQSKNYNHRFRILASAKSRQPQDDPFSRLDL